ncbi:DMT family transporter [Treponema socranskii]|uniref:DMT family transporter n=1 Tax=Treponema socranskii TaxID=53419 RepID=UPI003D6EAEE4
MSLKYSKSRTARGVFYIICSSFCFALMGMLAHLAGDIPFMQKAFFRNVIAFSIAFAVLAKEQREGKHPFALPKGSALFLLLRCIGGTIGIFGNFYALDKINIADASILNKMSPFFTVIFSFFILGEKIMPVPLAAICISIAGAALVIKPSFDIAAMLPALAGFLGGVSSGFAYTCVRRLRMINVNGRLIVACFSLFSLLLAVPFLLFHFSPMTTRQLLIMLAAGIAAAGGQFFITAAYGAAPAAKISIFDYSQIVFSSLMGFFAFGQIPDAMSFTGYAVIIAMAIVVFVYNRRHSDY